MNVMLLAAMENDLELISNNLYYLKEEQKLKLFYTACDSGSIDVIKFLLDNKHISEIDSIALRHACRTKTKRLEVLKLLIHYGAKDKGKVEPAFEFCVRTGDIECVRLFVENGFTQDIFNFLSQAILYDDRKLFLLLWPKDNQVHENLFYYALRHLKWEFALFIHEKANIALDPTKLHKSLAKVFFKYKEITTRSRLRAVRKIIDWWIPICYDLNRKCGQRMMEKNYQNFQLMYSA